MSDLVFHVTQDNFKKEVLENPVPVLVDFWAEWCGPCRALAPTLEAVATDLKDQIKVCKVDIEENPALATQFNIRNIPFMAIVVDGQKVGELIGNHPKQTIIDTVKKFMK